MQIYINVILMSFRLQSQTFRSLVRELRYFSITSCTPQSQFPLIPPCHVASTGSQLHTFHMERHFPCQLMAARSCYTAQLQNRPRATLLMPGLQSHQFFESMNGITLFKKQQVPVYCFTEHCECFLLPLFMCILTPKDGTNGKFLVYSLFYSTQLCHLSASWL